MANANLPDGVTLTMIKDNWDIATKEYAKAFKRAKILDGVDRGRLWQVLGATFPSYQITPDTNHVSYVKSNLLAALYSIGRCASIIPTSQADKDIAMELNVWLDHYWGTAQIPYYQMLAGERASLLNIGVSQVGWDNTVVGGSGDNFRKGQVVTKNLDPLKFMRDPYAEDIENSGYAMYPEDLHRSVIENNEEYAEAFKSFVASGKGASTTTQVVQKDGDIDKSAASSNKDYFRVITHWVKYEEKVHEIHTLDNQVVLHVKEDIQPSEIPIAILYCNLPAGDLIGTSEPSKIFANSVAYNVMNSTILTAEYKNQRPPRFINSMSKLDVRAFIKHGNDADHAFIVQGDASKAVHYHQFPQPSAAAPIIAQVLNSDIKIMSGVTDKYTGAETGSILTTGGMESMLDQATLIDQPKINSYERYSARLTKLILGNMINFSVKRSYFIKDKKNNKSSVVEIDFPEIDNEAIFDYEISISAALPKNKARIAQMANVLMEKQMQYAQSGNSQVDLITPEEWLMMQDLPMQEYMLERMGIQRSNDYVEQVSKILFEYSDLTAKGLPAEEALLATAQSLESEQQGTTLSPNDMELL